MRHSNPTAWLRKKFLFLSLTFNMICLICINLFCLQPLGTDPERPCVNGVNQPKSLVYKFQTNLLILVLVSPGSVKSRETIRQTWASDSPKGAVVKFVMGTKDLSDDVVDMLNDEQDKTGDIVYLDHFKESYNDLTKKLLLSLVWAADNVKFNYLLKADEDSFVRIDRVLEELKQKPVNRLYWGFFDGRASVKKAGKYEEKNYVLCDRYLPYALGGGYVISTDLVKYVASNSDYLKLYKNEDVSLGTWLSPLDIMRVHEVRFDTEYKSRGCFNSYLITHKQSAEDMRKLYTNLRKFNKLCIEEVRKRYSYNYNWTVPPSECCKRDADFI